MIGLVEKLQHSNAIQKVWSIAKNTGEKLFNYSRIIKNDYRWLLMFCLARFPWGRDLGSLFYRYSKSRSPISDLKDNFKERDLQDQDREKTNETREQTVFKNLNLDLAVESIRDKGYFLGLQLPEDMVQEILAYAYQAEISIDGNQGFEFKYADLKAAETKYDRQILIGNYLSINSECSAMGRLAQDSQLKAIAQKYLGTEPKLVRSQMGWTFVGNEADYTQKGEIGSPTVLFHYDLDDYRALKFFFYLTDVDDFSGSHRCVAQSHRKRKLMHYIFRSQSDQDIANYYGAENIINICGRAGYGFAEDPFCFHRGSPPITRPRLMIQLEFALNEYGMWEL